LRISARTAFILLAFTLVFTALMAWVYQMTKPVLDASAQDAKRRTITEVLPADAYDNDLLADAITLPAIPDLGLSETTTLYRARKDGQPAALVFETVAPDGYAGRIGLILAVRADGRLAAVRVTSHKETPGLGDYIDPKKDKNKAHPWITQFNNRNFSDTPREKWRVKKDGGVFDQHVGATISARAVTKATGRGLAWALDRIDALFAQPNGSEWKEP
jgi:electron transport complex protein RnfG